MRTFLQFVGCLASEARLLERPPFEILLVASADHTASCTLLAAGLGLITFESFCFAGYTAYTIY